MSSLPAISIILSLHLIAALLLLIASTELNGGVVAASNQREFDYFVLALQWPGTYCRKTKKCCKTNGCCRESNAPMEFTIHGLWPDYNDGSWPSCCTNSDFDMKKISTLRDALNKYWPSLSCGSPSTCHGHKGPFWAHEWEKHGTCASPVIRDEYAFFLTTLNVYFKYNVTKVLSEEGYVPSNSEKYPVGGIITAIENAFHMTPLIKCSNGAVEEIHLCFYKNFTPRDCATAISLKEVVDSSKSSCPKYVGLPIYASLGLNSGEISSQMQPNVEAL